MHAETRRYTVFGCPCIITHITLFSKYTDFSYPQIQCCARPYCNWLCSLSRWWNYIAKIFQHDFGWVTLSTTCLLTAMPVPFLINKVLLPSIQVLLIRHWILLNGEIASIFEIEVVLTYGTIMVSRKVGKTILVMSFYDYGSSTKDMGNTIVY